MATISFIVAMGKNRVIGRENGLPWHLPADLRRFRALTMGKAILMGRVTHESIGRALDGRHNIVITHRKDYAAAGCTVVHSIGEALRAAGEGEIMVIGGATIFEQMLPIASRIYLTLIDAEFEGDSHFPPIRTADWREQSREFCPADGSNSYDHEFIVLDKIGEKI